MKKIIILSSVLLSSIVCGQSSVTQNGSGIKYYTYGEKENNQVIISPAPGIFIQTPWLTKDISKRVTESMKESPSESALKVEKSESTVVPKPEKIMPEAAINNNNKINQSIEAEKQPAPKDQIKYVKKDIITNDISIWNKTSQEIISNNSNSKLAKQYQDFLAN